MEKKNLFHYICYVDTVYTLFLYLILFPDNINSTFFIFGNGIPKSIKYNFNDNLFIIKNGRGFLYSIYNIIRCWIILPYIYYKKNLSKKVSYGQDHLIFSNYIINKSSYFNLIEDGTGNYITIINDAKYKKRHKIIWKIKSLINKLRGLVALRWGFHKKIKNIYLRGILDIPPFNKEKICRFSMENKWNQLSQEQQRSILNLLAANNLMIKEKEFDILLLTQCFSEERIIKESKKIQMYKDILKEYIDKGLRICLKPHPRERTDYKTIFPTITIIPSHIPFEILNMTSDFKFKSAITVNSTAIYSLNNRIHKTILGDKFINKYR